MYTENRMYKNGSCSDFFNKCKTKTEPKSSANKKLSRRAGEFEIILIIF